MTDAGRQIGLHRIFAEHSDLRLRLDREASRDLVASIPYQPCRYKDWAEQRLYVLQRGGPQRPVRA